MANFNEQTDTVEIKVLYASSTEESRMTIRRSSAGLYEVGSSWVEDEGKASYVVVENNFAE